MPWMCYLIVFCKSLHFAFLCQEVSVRGMDGQFLSLRKKKKKINDHQMLSIVVILYIQILFFLQA